VNEAKIIADSISPEGLRLTTCELTIHRYVLSELNTHRAFSRNSASSRAIPVQKQIDKIREDLAYPVEFGTNKPGMQAGPQNDNDLERLYQIWEGAAGEAISRAQTLTSQYNIHKQVTNRLLEPFMWHKVIITSLEDGYDNFFNQRNHPDAQPEIHVAAGLLEPIYRASVPKEVDWGQWHLPYIQDDEWDNDIEVLKKISVARCARVSYLTHGGVRDFEEDINLFTKLISADPPHWSPLEHVATPFEVGLSPSGNFIEWFPNNRDDLYFPQGWAQFRHNN
jgi:thymidylate synthase ThyX